MVSPVMTVPLLPKTCSITAKRSLYFLDYRTGLLIIDKHANRLAVNCSRFKKYYRHFRLKVKLEYAIINKRFL